MAPRRKVRRTSSLPGLVSDDPTGLQAAAAAAVAVAAASASSSSTVANAPSTIPAVAPPPYSFTFTTNLTPTTFQHADKAKPDAAASTSSTGTAVAGAGPASPANSTSSATNSRKRNADALDEFYTDQLPTRKEDQPAHTRKFSAGHIPRPPNAFILFRSDLVARKAVPTSLEADHSTISKIIGVCWRTLPAKQRKRWEQKALEAKAAHKKMYPDYRYTPVHRKGASRKKAKKEQQKDDSRVEGLAQLLLSGSKGADLEAKMKLLDGKISTEGGPEEAAKAFQTTFSANGLDHSMMSALDQQQQQLLQQQQFTFVQGFPAGGHTIELPSAPNMQGFNSNNGTMYNQYGLAPNQPRRHSSAPPADAQFLDPTAGSSSSTASTPSTRELLLPPADDTTTVPLSRISRKLPTKSTHHLQPHHFHAEAQQIAAAAAHANLHQHQYQGYPGHHQQQGNGKKVKSSLAKAVRRAAQGLPASHGASERDQLFIQSHWTSAAVSGIDPSVILLNGGGKKKKKGGAAGGNGSKTAIPQDLLLPTWDVNATSNSNSSATSSASGTATANGHAHNGTTSTSASPIVDTTPAPQYGSPSQYSPAFAPVYPVDEKYGHGHFDASQVTEPYDFYNLTADNGLAPAAFDFANQFESLGVEETAEDYGYQYYQRTAELASGPTSADSTSPHTSDVEDAAAFHPYDGLTQYSPQTQRMPYTQDQSYSQPPSAHPDSLMYGAVPDWSAFESFGGVLGSGNGASATTAPAVDPLESLDPLDPLAPAEPLDSNRFHSQHQFGFDFAYPPLPASGPSSEVGDADQDVTGFDFGSYQTHHSTLHSHPHSQSQQQQQQGGRAGQLNLNLQHPHGSAPAPTQFAEYGYSPITATSPATDIADQISMFNLHSLTTPVKAAASPVGYHSPHVSAMNAAHPHAHPHAQAMGHPQHPHSHPHAMPQQHGMHPHHAHTHSTHSTTMDYHHQEPVSVNVASEQWSTTAWNNPDPFATTNNGSAGTDGGNIEPSSEGMSGGLDPLAPGVAVVDYRV